MKNVLVTGGTGFIGSNLASALLEQGCVVKVFRRPNSDLRALDGIDVLHAIGDVRDRESLLRAMHGCDTVFHTAALVSYWRKERETMFDVNVGGTRNVVDCCLELGIERLIHTSSIAAIGFPSGGGLADESNVFNWEEYDVGYRNSKRDAENEIHRGIRLGLNSVIVNPAVVIGPRDIRFHGGQLLRDIQRKRIFYYVSGGMNIVYVGDVVAGHLLAARLGRSGERYILCGENLSHRQIITTVAETVGGIRPLFRMPAAVVSVITAISEFAARLMNQRPWVSRELLAGSHLPYYFSCRKAAAELGYRYTPFRDAVQITYAWYRDNGYL